MVNTLLAWCIALLVRAIEVGLAIAEALLALRFVLELLGANPYAGFTQWIFVTASPLMEPFNNIFQSLVFLERYAINFSVLCAMVVYALLGTFLLRVLASGRASVSREE